MTKRDSKSLIFDTSALLRLVNDEKGSDIVSSLLEERLRKNKSNFVSSITAYEIVSVMARRDVQSAVSAISFFEKLCKFVPLSAETAQNAALLRKKYFSTGISMADALIIQTGIDCDAQIITADKAWKKIDDANVQLIR